MLAYPTLYDYMFAITMDKKKKLLKNMNARNVFNLCRILFYTFLFIIKD